MNQNDSLIYNMEKKRLGLPQEQSINQFIIHSQQQKPNRISWFKSNAITPSLSDSLKLPLRSDKIKKIKKTTLSQKQIVFQRSTRDRNIRKIFEGLMTDQHFKQDVDFHIRNNSQTTIKNIKISKQLVSSLYRQNIKNYNPYIATLELLEQDRSLCPIEKDRMSSLCHIGIAKFFLRTKKYSQGPTYSRVNVLIRTYMRDKMCEQVKYKQQNYDSVIFIPTSQLALSFNPINYPKDHFSAVIAGVNQIIQTQYVQYKSCNTLNFSESLTGKLILGVMAIIGCIFVLNHSKYLLFLIFALFLTWIVHSILQCQSKLQKLVQSKNVTLTILQKINHFFEGIRTDRIEWKVGQDFYWLQIHYIKKKKKYNTAN